MSQAKKISILVCEPMAEDGIDMLSAQPNFFVDSVNLDRRFWPELIGIYQN
jgi:hypothetical protein